MKRILCVAACLFALGCARGALQQQPVEPPAPADSVDNLGQYLIWAGGLGSAILTVAAFIVKQRWIASAIMGCVSVVFMGVAYSWLGQHRWAIWLLVIGTLAALGYRHRVAIRRLLRLAPCS